MKKILCLSLALIMTLAFVACSNGGAKTEAKEIDIVSLGEKMIADLNVDARNMPASALGELYGIDEADVADASFYSADGGSFPDEIIMVKATDADAATRIKEKLEKRLENVKQQSRNYDEKNYAQAQQCKVMVSGNYIALFISAQHAEMEAMFEEASK